MEKVVFFRTFEEEDAELIYQWMNDDDLKRLSVGLNRRMSRSEALEWVRNKIPHNPYQVYWAVCARDTGRMIGYASLVNIHYINSSAETGAIMIADPDYRDGFAWLETALFLLEYAFERLGLNRVCGESIVGHKMSNLMEKLLFMQHEGIRRQAIFKNGRFYDLSCGALLKEEYFSHKEAGEYELMTMIRRLRSLKA